MRAITAFTASVSPDLTALYQCNVCAIVKRYLNKLLVSSHRQHSVGCSLKCMKKLKFEEFRKKHGLQDILSQYSNI